MVKRDVPLGSVSFPPVDLLDKLCSDHVGLTENNLLVELFGAEIVRSFCHDDRILAQVEPDVGIFARVPDGDVSDAVRPNKVLHIDGPDPYLCQFRSFSYGAVLSPASP